jgi:hypothetical protein
MPAQPARPLISVVIPVYNAEPYVAEAVRSATRQPVDLEVILVEDGSTDGSLAVCERLSRDDGRVRLVRHPRGENRGEAASRNLGVLAARGTYVAFLDADDYMLPNRFDVDVPLLESDTHLDGAYGAVKTIYEGDVANDHRLPELTTLRREVAPANLFEELAGVGSERFCVDGVTVRRTLFARTGLFDEELVLSTDSAMWLKMAAVGSLAHGSLHEAVAVRRRHGANVMKPSHPLYHDSACAYTFSALAWARREGLDASRLDLLRRRLIISIFGRLEDAGPAERLRRVARRIWRYGLTDTKVAGDLYLLALNRVLRLIFTASHYLVGWPGRLPGGAAGKPERGGP